ncbi:MAG TPA: choice-of-anchor D domain-containing protein [Chloroflexota bacterium]|nr:choice-of-anchor D domain-containing protein [Chloroflexota bacterium]
MAFTRGHALLIGVGTYRHDPPMDVPVTVRDAKAVAGVLADPRSCGYPTEQVELLHDAGATRDGVLAALDAFAGRTAVEDTAVVFYCGHGAFGDDGQYHLTTHDTQFVGKRKRVASGTGVSQQELLARVKALPVRRALLVFNACHSGAVSPTLSPTPAVPEAEPEALAAASLPTAAAEALLGTGEGRVIVTACREDQVSFIGGGPLTVFTQALVDSLRGQGVPNRGGLISAFDLYTAVYESVSEAVRTRYGREQEPELTVQKGVGPMAVALYGGAEAPGAFDAPAEPAQGPGVRTVTPERAGRQFRVLMLNLPPLAPLEEAAPLAPLEEAAPLAAGAGPVARAAELGQSVLQTARHIGQGFHSVGQTVAAHLPLLVGAAILVPVTAVAVTAGVRYTTAPPTTTSPPSPRTTTAPPTSPTSSRPALVHVNLSSHNFGALEVGQTSGTQQLVLRNEGQAPLAIRSIVASDGFAQANDCGGRVLPGAYCAIRVTFAPRAVGGQSGTLTIAHDGPGSPHTVALSGTGR